MSTQHQFRIHADHEWTSRSHLQSGPIQPVCRNWKCRSKPECGFGW